VIDLNPTPEMLVKHPWYKRAYWMKRPGAPDSDDEADKVKEARDKDKAERIERDRRNRELAEQKRIADDKKAGTEKGGDGTAVKPAEPKPDETTPEAIAKKLKVLLEMRGKKGTDRMAMINDLKLLATHTKLAAPLLKIHVMLCSALFDLTLNAGGDMHMPIAYWHDAHNVLMEIVRILDKEPLVRLSEDDTAVEEAFESVDDPDQKVIEKFVTRASEKQIEEEKERKIAEEKKLVRHSFRSALLSACADQPSVAGAVHVCCGAVRCAGGEGRDDSVRVRQFVQFRGSNGSGV
jgi:hypothetical protein